MSADTAGAPVPADTAGPKPPPPVSPEERGHLTVNDRVVEKVAGYAVTLVTDAAAPPRRVLGVRIGEAKRDDAASVHADVNEDVGSAQVAIAVRWPASVQKVAAEVRQRIRSEVESLTGVRVDHVDVEVVSMTMPGLAEPRVR